MTRIENDGFVGETDHPVVGDVLAPINDKSVDFFTTKPALVIATGYSPPSGGHDPYPGYITFELAELSDDGSYPQSSKIVKGHIGCSGIRGPRTVYVLRQMTRTISWI